MLFVKLVIVAVANDADADHVSHSLRQMADSEQQTLKQLYNTHLHVIIKCVHFYLFLFCVSATFLGSLSMQ